MNLNQILEKIKKDGVSKLKRRVYRYLAYFIGFLGFFIAFGMVFPSIASIILNVIWISLFAIVATFLTLGILVLFGLKEEVAEVLDILLEGSLTLLDAVDFLEKLWERFKEMAKEFLLFSAPIFAYVTNLILYILLLIIYKTVGLKNDITILTLILTTLMMTFAGIINSPKKNQKEPRWLWIKTFKEKFHRGFSDGLGVIIFIFFLTMDSTNLIFLPSRLSHKINAKIGSYNLMERGFDLTTNTKFTLTLIIITITIEVLRNMIRLVTIAKSHYTALIEKERDEENDEFKISKTEKIKVSIRTGFKTAQDDLVKFIALTTLLLMVFLLFPRLKLLTLATASITSLILDFAIKGRLTIKKGDDLISRILNKIFKL